MCCACPLLPKLQKKFGVFWNIRTKPEFFRSPMSLKVVDIFFYEELSRIAGHEKGSQWLLAQTNKLGRTRMSIASTGCSSTPCRTPVHSAPSSPLSQQMYVEAMASTGNRGSLYSLLKPCTSSMQIDSVDLPLHQIIKCASLNLRPSSSFKSDPSMIGLIFTDAAHSVLE